MYKIYILIDPFTNQVRYVGRTIKALRTRLCAHISEKSNTRKNTWIKSLNGISPEIDLVDQCITESECNELEIFWIAYFKLIGCNLTNHTIGGEGASGNKISIESKIKRSLKRTGYKLSEETKKKISDSKKNLSKQARKNLSEASKKRGMPRKVIDLAIEKRKNRSIEEKEKYAEIIRKSNKSRPISDQTRERYKLRFKGKLRPEDVKKKISESLKIYHATKTRQILPK